MEERTRRIVETAVDLAEKGGFEAVRLRDVAAHAGVALGTLYRRFHSKEDLLVAALEQETGDLESRFLERPPQGATEIERVSAFFGLATRGLLRRPHLARALLKAVASGEPELAQKVASFHDRIERMIVASMRGAPVRDAMALNSLAASEAEADVAATLDLIWFALLVGWSGAVHGQLAVSEKMSTSASLVLRGSREIG